MKIIGQEKLIHDVTRILEIFTSSETPTGCEIRPHFILTGPSGSGKTLTIGMLAKKMDLGFLEVNAAQLTKEGTAGNSLSKALSPLQRFAGKPCVVFVDEFDKLFLSGNSNSSIAHETTTGVQNEFLKVLESKEASVYGDYGKYINIPITNTLFVFAGAFNGEVDIDLDRLREIGLKTEFLGRVGLVFNTRPLDLESLYQIIDNSELLDKYCVLFEDADKEKVQLELKGYIQKNYEFNTIGARMINTLINQYFINGGFKEEEVKKIVFTKKLKLKD